MKRAILSLVLGVTLVACEKPAEKSAATETAAQPATAAQPEPETAPESQPDEHGHNHDHGEKKAAALPDDLKPGEQGFFGAKFTVIEEPISLADAIKNPSDKTIKVNATVASVCKKKGCWFTMSGEGVEEDVRVKMKDYSFFVPRNSEKAQVVAEGVLSQREIPQDEAQHYADDAAEAGEEPKKVDGPQKVWEFTATAIELKAVEG